MQITASMVKELRQRTGAGMMDCKKALTECNGDIEVAIEWLKKKYKGKMQEREGRNTDEGRIGIFIDEAKKAKSSERSRSVTSGNPYAFQRAKA